MPLVINFSCNFFWYKQTPPLREETKTYLHYSLNLFDFLWEEARLLRPLVPWYFAVMTSLAHYSWAAKPCLAITLLKRAKSIFTGMLMALEMSGGPHRVLLGPTVSSNRTSSGDLMKHLSHFATGVLQPSLGLRTAEPPQLSLAGSGVILLFFTLCGVME